MFTEYHITIDSFGQECPKNWEEIAAYLNDKIDSLTNIDDERDEVDSIWEEYWNQYHSETLPVDAPVPEIE